MVKWMVMRLCSQETSLQSGKLVQGQGKDGRLPHLYLQSRAHEFREPSLDTFEHGSEVRAGHAGIDDGVIIP